MLPNHSKGLTCLASVLASVLVLVNASISVAAMEGFLGLRKTLRNGAKTWGKMKNSRRAVTKSACVSGPTDGFILIEKMVGQNLTQTSSKFVEIMFRKL